MADFKDIRAAIVAAIPSGAGELIQAVYGYERSTFAGFPAVVVTPSDNEADYASTVSDKVTFIFKVRAYYPIGKEADQEAAEGALEEVVDELLDLFRNRSILGSACEWVVPAPGTWFYEERSEVPYRAAEITLKCIKFSSNR